MVDRPQARTEGIVSEWVEDDLVIYDQVSHTAHSLSAAAATVWKLSDGRHTATDISQESGLGLPVVEHASAELEERGLLAVAGAADGTVDVSGLGYSRREAAKKFAQVGAAALTAPLIYSVAVPAAAAAASCAVGTVKCGSTPNVCCNKVLENCCGSGTGATCCSKLQNCCGNTCCPIGQSCISITAGCCVTSQICFGHCCPAGQTCQEGKCKRGEDAPIRPGATPTTSTSTATKPITPTTTTTTTTPTTTTTATTTTTT